MKFKWLLSQEKIVWKELSNLYRLAPLGEKKPTDLEMSFTNSMYKCFVYESNQLIGAGRALADGVDCSYICDVAVLPGYQGHGLGKEIINKLIQLSNGHKKIILYSVPGKESFYKKSGFMHMNTAMAIFNNQEQAVLSGLISET